MSKSTKSKGSNILLGVAVSLLMTTAQAAPPSVAGSEWDLGGSFKGTIKVKCRTGGGVSKAIKSPAKLQASILFEDGDALDDDQGTFTLNDPYFTLATVATGTWQQTGSKLKLVFDNPNASPMAVFAGTLAQGFGATGIDFSQGGVSGSTSAFEVIKPTITGTINSKGNSLTIKEAMGFKFTASASALGSANSCTYTFNNMGRSYKGVRALMP